MIWGSLRYIDVNRAILEDQKLKVAFLKYSWKQARNITWLYYLNVESFLNIILLPPPSVSPPPPPIEVAIAVVGCFLFFNLPPLSPSLPLHIFLYFQTLPPSPFLSPTKLEKEENREEELGSQSSKVRKEIRVFLRLLDFLSRAISTIGFSEESRSRSRIHGLARAGNRPCRLGWHHQSSSRGPIEARQAGAAFRDGDPAAVRRLQRDLPPTAKSSWTGGADQDLWWMFSISILCNLLVDLLLVSFVSCVIWCFFVLFSCLCGIL